MEKFTFRGSSQTAEQIQLIQKQSTINKEVLQKQSLIDQLAKSSYETVLDDMSFINQQEACNEVQSITTKSKDNEQIMSSGQSSKRQLPQNNRYLNEMQHEPQTQTVVENQ